MSNQILIPNENARKHFLVTLRTARERAIKDAEDFDSILHAIERLGSYLCQTSKGSLGAYQKTLSELASISPLHSKLPETWRTYHKPFDLLYDIVKDSRNDAFHVGAFARHLTQNCIELCLILEDAIQMNNLSPKIVADYMVSNPVCAEAWQPISFIRQQMLTNAFTYLPIYIGGEWKFVSDIIVAKYLNTSTSKNEKKKRLSHTLSEAKLELPKAVCISPETRLEDVFNQYSDYPILICRPEKKTLLGIVTAFDLL